MRCSFERGIINSTEAIIRTVKFVLRILGTDRARQTQCTIGNLVPEHKASDAPAFPLFTVAVCVRTQTNELDNKAAGIRQLFLDETFPNKTE